MTIHYTPYIGKKGSIITVHKAEIMLFDRHIEVVIRYDYKNELDKDDYVKVACTMPKAMLSVSRVEMSPVNDPGSDDIIEAVFLECAGTGPVHIKMKTEQEANKIYQQIKKWMVA